MKKDGANSKYALVPIYAVFAVLGATFSLLRSDTDAGLPTFFAELSIIFAVLFYFAGRIQRRGAVVTPITEGNLEGFVSRLGELFRVFGYRPVPPTIPGRWDFEVPVPLARFTWRRISVELAGPGLARTTGSRVVLTRVREAFPSTVEAPYMNPQPFMSRGGGLLVPAAMAVMGLCFSGLVYFMIIRS